MGRCTKGLYIGSALYLSAVLPTTVALLTVVIMGSTHAYSADLNGKWKSDTGAIYAVAQKDSNLLAVVDVPNALQMSSGTKSGDVAFTGSVLGDFIIATFYQRFSTETVPACVASWYSGVTIYFQLSTDERKLEGDLLRTHADDNCVPDKHWLQHLTLERQ